MSYDVYCDESCHLEHDDIRVMALGAVWCPSDKTHSINKRIREIKAKRGLSQEFEAKWTKISPRHVALATDLVDYFFDDDDLHFRGVVIPDKTLLQHAAFEQTHDVWYYKMLFVLLKVILDPNHGYRIYLDYKDTKGGQRVRKLHEVLSNNYYDYSRSIIKAVRLVRSHEVGIMQLADLLVGVLTYLHRSLTTNAGKLSVVKRVAERSGYSLFHSTLYREQKFNLLIWEPDERFSE